MGLFSKAKDAAKSVFRNVGVATLTSPVTGESSALSKAILAGGAALVGGGAGGLGPLAQQPGLQNLLANFGIGAGAPKLPTAALPGGAEVPMFGNFGSGSGLSPVGFNPRESSPVLMTDSGQVIDWQGSGGSTMQVALPGLGAAAGAAARGATGLARMAGNVVLSAAGRIRGLVTSTGQFIATKRAARITRFLGLQAAAAALGVSAVELAQTVLQDAGKVRRRGRGISGADVRRTVRTMKKLQRLNAAVGAGCRSAHFARGRR